MIWVHYSKYCMIFLNTNNTNLLPEDNENVNEMKKRKFQNLYYVNIKIIEYININTKFEILK